MKQTVAIVAIAVPMGLVGCSSDFPRNMPLLFAETNTVGISIAATTGDQGGDFTLGYKSRDIAIVPVVVLKPDGSVEQIKGKETHPSGSANPQEFEDAYSVLGQFDTKTAGTGHQVGLGRFFATGQAAVYLSEGFQAQLANTGPKSRATGDAGTQNTSTTTE